MQVSAVLGQLVGCEQAVPEGAWFEEDGQAIVILVRLKSRARRRCGVCGSRCPRFDTGQGRRRWRHLDAAGLKLFLEADAPRVSCPEHGVVVAAVPGTLVTSTSRWRGWPPSAPSPRPRS